MYYFQKLKIQDLKSFSINNSFIIYKEKRE